MKRSNFLVVLVIVVFSLFVRLYGFSDQWDIFGDAGRDKIVGWASLERVKVPLSGSFSSSGPFVFGPLYYWFILLSYRLLPVIPDAPELLFRLVQLLPIIFLYKAGYLIGRRRLAWVAAVLTATSPELILRTINMTHHGLVVIISSALIWLFAIYLKREKGDKGGGNKLLVSFFIGLVFGIGYNIHFQTINLWPLFFAYLLHNRFAIRRIWPEILALIVGFLLPNLAYFWWDAVNHWANQRNFLDYILIGQGRRYVPNRWLSYLFTFWPDIFSSVVGGFRIFGYLLPVLIVTILALGIFRRRRLPPFLFWLGVIFILMAIVLRYYRGEMFSGYFIYFYPFIILFSAWAIDVVFAHQKILGISLFAVIVLSNTAFNWRYLLRDFAGGRIDKVQETISLLTRRFPDKTFIPYVWGSVSEDQGYGLVIMLLRSGKLSADGMPIGFCQPRCLGQYPIINQVTWQEEVTIVDLSHFDVSQENAVSARENPPGQPWKLFTPAAIYGDVAEWWKEKPLHSTFSLAKYILEKVGL